MSSLDCFILAGCSLLLVASCIAPMFTKDAKLVSNSFFKAMLGLGAVSFAVTMMFVIVGIVLLFEELSV